MTEQLTSTVLSHEYLDHVTSAISLQNENSPSFRDDETRHSGVFSFRRIKWVPIYKIQKVSCGFFKNSFVHRRKRFRKNQEGKDFARTSIMESPAIKEEHQYSPRCKEEEVNTQVEMEKATFEFDSLQIQQTQLRRFNIRQLEYSRKIRHNVQDRPLGDQLVEVYTARGSWRGSSDKKYKRRKSP